MAAAICTVHSRPHPTPTPGRRGRPALRRCLLRAAPSPAPPPLPAPTPPPPAPSQEDSGREPAWGGGGGVDVSVCHGGGRRKGRERRGARERERAASEEGGREAGPPTWGALAPSQLLCRGRESPGEADKCGHIGRRGARRGAHGPRRLRPGQAAPAQPPRSGPARSPPALVGPRGRSVARRGCAPRLGHSPAPAAAPGSPWWQRAPSARASPAAGAAAPAERGPPGPRPPAAAASPPPPLFMAQPPALDHAQKLSQVDFLRVSLLWRPLREARVSNAVGRAAAGGRAAAQPPPGSPAGTSGPAGARAALQDPGRPGCWLLAPAAPGRSRTPERRVLPRAPSPGPRAGWRVAASVPGAYFHLFGLQAPGVGRAFPPPGCAGR